MRSIPHTSAAGTKRESSPRPWGLPASDWRYLHDQILAKLPEGEVRSTHITPFGIAYEVIVLIDGLNGRTVPVVTTWMVAASDHV